MLNFDIMFNTIMVFIHNNIGWIVILLFVGAFIGAASLDIDDENPE